MPQLAAVGRGMNPGNLGVAGPPPTPWAPTDLGAALLGWLNADRADLITETAGAVSSWRDAVAAYDFVQAVGASQPTYSATSYNGSPGITFDGTADELTLASVPFPSSAAASQIWAVVDQAALAADVTSRVIFGYGGDANTNQRRLYRSVTTGQNRIFALSGTGGAAPTASLAANFSGRHYVRGNFTATGVAAGMDGTMTGATAAVPATGTNRCRIGAVPNVAVGNFFEGVIREIIVTGALTAGQVTDMNTYLAGRI
jgi:hypothetical protein